MAPTAPSEPAEEEGSDATFRYVTGQSARQRHTARSDRTV